MGREGPEHNFKNCRRYFQYEANRKLVKISTEAGLEVGVSEIWYRSKHLHPDQALTPWPAAVCKVPDGKKSQGTGDRDMHKCSGKIIQSLIQKDADKDNQRTTQLWPAKDNIFRANCIIAFALSALLHGIWSRETVIKGRCQVKTKQHHTGVR